MIVHDLPLPVKQIRIATYHFCVVLVLVVLQIEILQLFVCNLRLHIVPGV